MTFAKSWNQIQRQYTGPVFCILATTQYTGPVFNQICILAIVDLLALALEFREAPFNEVPPLFGINIESPAIQSNSFFWNF